MFVNIFLDSFFETGCVPSVSLFLFYGGGRGVGSDVAVARALASY